MAKVKNPTSPSASGLKPIRPALNPQSRENQMISLAVDLVEQRLRDGTASAQETVHYLKLASTKAKLESERAQLENELIRAKIQSLRDQADIKKLYNDAIDAMRRYSGHGNGSEEQEQKYNEY